MAMERKGASQSREDEGELRRRVLSITSLRMSGEIDEMLQYFAPDVVVHYHCTKEGLFLPGMLRGATAFRENMRLTDAEYEPLGYEVLDVVVDKENTAVRWRNSWRQRGTGRLTTLDMAHFLRWRNGKVVEAFEYLDYHDESSSAPYGEIRDPYP
jgi:ketosteroid isomerase-like protein